MVLPSSQARGVQGMAQARALTFWSHLPISRGPNTGSLDIRELRTNAAIVSRPMPFSPEGLLGKFIPALGGLSSIASLCKATSIFRSRSDKPRRKKVASRPIPRRRGVFVSLGKQGEFIKVCDFHEPCFFFCQIRKSEEKKNRPFLRIGLFLVWFA